MSGWGQTTVARPGGRTGRACRRVRVLAAALASLSLPFLLGPFPVCAILCSCPFKTPHTGAKWCLQTTDQLLFPIILCVSSPLLLSLGPAGTCFPLLGTPPCLSATSSGQAFPGWGASPGFTASSLPDTPAWAGLGCPVNSRLRSLPIFGSCLLPSLISTLRPCGAPLWETGSLPALPVSTALSYSKHIGLLFLSRK